MALNRAKLRFGLRTLVIILTLVTAMIAYLGLLYSNCQRESKIIEKLVESGVGIDTSPKSDRFIDKTFQGTLVLSSYSVNLLERRDSVPPNDELEPKQDELMELIAQLRHVHKLSYQPDKDLRQLSNLNDLRRLEILGWTTDTLEGIQYCSQLEKLHLHDSDHIQSLEPLRDMSKLEVFYQSLEDSTRLILAPEIVATWTSLREFEIMACDQVTLEGFRNLSRLEILDIGHADETTTGFEALEDMSSLTKLSLPECGQLKNLNCFSSLQNLKELVLYDCVKLKNVDGISKLPNLEKVSLADGHELSDLSSFENIKSLKELTIVGGSECPPNWVEQRTEQADSLRTALPTAKIRIRK